MNAEESAIKFAAAAFPPGRLQCPSILNWSRSDDSGRGAVRLTDFPTTDRVFSIILRPRPARRYATFGQTLSMR